MIYRSTSPYTYNLVESQKGRDTFADLCPDEYYTESEVKCEVVVDWMFLAQDSLLWPILVNTVINERILKM